MKSFIIIFLSIFALVGCSQESAQSFQSQQLDKLDIDYIKENTWLNLTQDEVKHKLGSAFSEITSSKEGQLMWRFDIGTIKDYKYEEQYDFADLKGLKNGDIKMQLFISWTVDSRVESISALYLNETDGKIYEYLVFPDGGEREKAIN